MTYRPEPLPRQSRDGHRPNVRFDERTEVYRDCKFCGGRGCLACPGERDKAYAAAFPNGPQPIATMKIEEIGQLKDVLGPQAIERYKREGGFDDGSFATDLTAKLAEIRGES